MTNSVELEQRLRSLASGSNGAHDYDTRRLFLVAADEILRWRKAFMSVTPSGSEYTDPERCVAFVQDIRRSYHDAMCELAKERKRPSSALDVLCKPGGE